MLSLTIISPDNAPIFQFQNPDTIFILDIAKFAVECVSLSIVSFFLIEFLLKLWAFGVRFYLNNWAEMFDAIVILVSFGIDIYMVVVECKMHLICNANYLFLKDQYSSDNQTAAVVNTLPEAAGFLVVFRLWRVLRIANGKHPPTSYTKPNFYHAKPQSQ